MKLSENLVHVNAGFLESEKLRENVKLDGLDKFDFFLKKIIRISFFIQNSHFS